MIKQRHQDTINHVRYTILGLDIRQSNIGFIVLLIDQHNITTRALGDGNRLRIRFQCRHRRHSFQLRGEQEIAHHVIQQDILQRGNTQQIVQVDIQLIKQDHKRVIRRCKNCKWTCALQIVK